MGGLAKAKGQKRRVVSAMLANEQVDRFDELEARATERNQLAKRQHLMLELLGLADFGLTTEDERRYFRGKRHELPPIEKEPPKRRR